MATILGIGKAETAPKCLACHALDVPASGARAHVRPERRSELRELPWSRIRVARAAHGARLDAREIASPLGMYDTRDLTKRTEKCLSCHLGNEEKSVDHEMIAAGHPDLYFELDSFSAVMPRHWKEPGEPGEAGK